MALCKYCGRWRVVVYLGLVMQIHTKEHYDLIAQFERDMAGMGRMDREDKSMWARGIIYQSGEMNALFKAYRMGAAYGKSEALA
jgi:hypothetical protein